MNKKQLSRLGVPEEHLDLGVECCKNAAQAKFFHGRNANAALRDILANPQMNMANPHFGRLASAIVAYREAPIPKLPDPFEFPVWGNIDEQSLDQMRQACRLPVAAKSAVMPDSHLGYGLPIGGVWAARNAVMPYGVGVDISCSMRCSILPLKPTALKSDQRKFWAAIEKGTQFGIGAAWKEKQSHPVMDADWSVTKTTKLVKDKAWAQLGTSGSGNHFVEFGKVTLDKPDLGLEAGEYLALLSHSGSRGAGANIWSVYTDVAMSKLPPEFRRMEGFDKHLAWLSLNSEAGIEYWHAMQLMHDYAKANHEVIHQNVLELVGVEPINIIFNSHNLAWKEVHDGEELVVHRKGATPAGKGILGIIPGSMADPGFIVRGKGNESSLRSASHGAGRRMSRREAIRTFDKEHWKGVLRQRGVVLMSGGIDEMPGCYKNILEVMEAQKDLVEIVARFDPMLVKMSDDGKNED